jgi:hypothetical protein
MSRKADPKLFPTNPNLHLSLSLLPQFNHLVVVLVNFASVLMGEFAEATLSPKTKDGNLEMLIEMWLASGVNDGSVGVDTAGFSMATIIRDCYQEPVLEKTIESLKPAAIQLMDKIDRWLMDGIRLVFSPRPPNNDASDFYAWTVRQRLLIRELRRIATASGSGPHNVLTPGTSPSATPPKKKKGRPKGTIKSDPAEDAKLYTDWKAADTDIADFCHRRGLRENDVRPAIDRHKSRLKSARRRSGN